MRPRQGSAYVKRGTIVVQVRLRADAPRRFWIAPCPPRADGVAVDLIHARAVAADLQRLYDAGQWDPLAPVSAPAPSSDASPVVSVADFADRWAQEQTHETAPRERRTLARLLGRAPLGALLVTEVRPRHAAEFLAWLKAQPTHRGGSYAPRSIRVYCELVARVFGEAVVRELLPSNPFDRVKGRLPAIEDKDPEARSGWFLTREEVRALLTDPCVPAVRRVVYAVELLTGCRPGELAALRWGDWDRSAQPLTRLTIRRARKSVSGKSGPTKTRAVKVVPVHPALEAALTAWWSEGWQRAMGKAPRAEDLVAPTKNGRMRLGTKANAQFALDLTRLGLRVRHHYCTRHTFITQTQEDGADPHWIRWITHAPPRSAFDGYTRGQWGRLCAEVVKLRVLSTTPGLTPSDAGHTLSARETPTDAQSGAVVVHHHAASQDDAEESDTARFSGVRNGEHGAMGTVRDGLTPHTTPPGVDGAPGVYAGEARIHGWHERALLADAEGEAR